MEAAAKQIKIRLDEKHARKLAAERHVEEAEPGNGEKGGGEGGSGAAARAVLTLRATLS